MDRTRTLVHVTGSIPQEFTAYGEESLAQRPAGSVGKDGVCNLSFVIRQDKTQLQRAFVTHPFHLTTPWHLDPALPGMAVVYLQTPAGGLIQGDRASLQFKCGPHTQVHLTTQAAEKIHTMTNNCALQRTSFTLDANAYVEYCPEPVILFPDARFAQTIDITLGPKASFFLTEIVLPRGGADGTSFAAFSSTLRAYDSETGLLMHDRSLALPRHHNLNGPGVLGGGHLWGQAFLIGPVIPPPWVREIHVILSSLSGVTCGAAALPKARGICVKAVGTDVRALRQALFLVWNYVRMRLFNVPATVFPK